MRKNRILSGGNVDIVCNLTHGGNEMTYAIAAFPESREFLSETVRAMTIDVAALRRPLRRCDLAECRGTCCHDGVYLSSEEARVIRDLSGEAREEFESIGAQLPEQAVVYGKWRDITSGPKTATREEKRKGGVPEGGVPDGGVPDYPDHFPDTSCVFLLSDARCSLQVLASDRGLHPWHYKPLTCWLHPLSITAGEDRKPRLTLFSEETDPQRYEDYDGFVCRTHCGRTEPEGEAAWKVLGEELEVLGEIGGRDLIAEIRAVEEM